MQKESKALGKKIQVVEMEHEFRAIIIFYLRFTYIPTLKNNYGEMK
jgi:hypothetical protein